MAAVRHRGWSCGTFAVPKQRREIPRYHDVEGVELQESLAKPMQDSFWFRQESIN